MSGMWLQTLLWGMKWVKHTPMTESRIDFDWNQRVKCRAMSKVERRLGSGRKFWRRVLWYSDTQSNWLEAILPTCSKKARKRFGWKSENDFCAPSQSQSSLALSRPLWLLARCRWDSSNHAFSPWSKKTHRNLSPKRPNVTNATPLHNSKIGWGFHTTLLRCKVGNFQLTNPSAKLLELRLSNFRPPRN